MMPQNFYRAPHFGSTGGIFGSGRHGEFVVFVGLKEADLEVS